MEPDISVDQPEVEGEERRALRLLLGGRTLRGRKLRRIALAYLLREGDEAEDDDTEESEEEGGGEERRALRLLLGARTLRGRKLRRLALAKLLGERGEAEDETPKRRRAAAKNVVRCAYCSAPGRSAAASCAA